MLTVSTDPMGTVSVHWGEVAGLTSPRNFDVEAASGQHYYGSFLPAAAGAGLEVLIKVRTQK